MNQLIRVFLTLLVYTLSFSLYAKTPITLYINGKWDPECSKCWPAPQTEKNNHCKPTDCAIQGFYHCNKQNPPLALDDDPRFISLVKSGQCTFVPNEAMAQQESAYANSLAICTMMLDRIAGRFSVPPGPSNDDTKKGFSTLSEMVTHLKIPIDQIRLAMMYDQGRGTRQDRNKATQLFTEVANDGSPLAQYVVGARYAYGISVPRNVTTAMDWLNKVLVTKPSNKLDALAIPCAKKLIERLQYAKRHELKTHQLAKK